MTCISSFPYLFFIDAQMLVFYLQYDWISVRTDWSSFLLDILPISKLTDYIHVKVIELYTIEDLLLWLWQKY